MNSNGKTGLPDSKRMVFRSQLGFSLIELLVGMLISLFGSLIIFQVFAISEGQKRTATSGSDAQETGGFAMFQLERLVRGAGSGFSQGAIQSLWGCQITAYRSGVKILPSPTVFPAPFAAVSSTVRLVPILIQSGGAGAADSLTVMYGRADMLNVPATVKGTPTATSVVLLNTVGIRQNDLLLAVETGNPCTIVQTTDPLAAPVAGAVVGVLPNPVNLGGAGVYNHTATGLAAYTANAKLIDIGNAVAGSRPGLQLFGIDSTTNQLVNYDLLNLDGVAKPAPVPLADNIVNLKAIYGVDTSAGAGDNVVDSWLSPTGAFSAASLTDGSCTAASNLARIKSIRLALVARSVLREKNVVTAALPALFADTTVPVTITLTPEDRHYRYYLYDVVIPLRNMLLIPSASCV